MTHIITNLCVRDGSCVEVCPVDCIVPGPRGDEQWPYFYIDPHACIDCRACIPACPVEAIFFQSELPLGHADDIDRNRRYFIEGPGYWPFDLAAERDLVSRPS